MNFLRMAYQPEHGTMSEAATTQSFVRQELVRAARADKDHRPRRGSRATACSTARRPNPLTIVSALLLWFIIVPRSEFTADRCGLDRQGRMPACREGPGAGRRLLAVHAGQVPAVHVRILSREPALARQPGVRSCSILLIRLIPVLNPRLNAILFFLALPIVAFFCCMAAGMKGLGVSWPVGGLSRQPGIADGNGGCSAGGRCDGRHHRNVAGWAWRCSY